MTRIFVERSIGKIILVTTESTIRYYLEATSKDWRYIPWLKEWGYVTDTVRVYDGNKPPLMDPDSGTWTYTIGLGWAAYLINVLKPYITQEDLDNLLNDAIYSESFRDYPFPELRDYQNTDVLHLLKYRLGLFTCYTGYGKTQVIATITNYAYGLGKKILLVTPGKKAKDELVKRCKSAFGLDVPSKDGRIGCIITTGLTNRKDYRDVSKRKQLAAKLSQYDWVLADEVEYTINDAGEFIYSSVLGATNLYGFSGTSDKDKAESITFINGLSDVIARNKVLVKYFGPNLVYRMPLGKEISDIVIKTEALDRIVWTTEDFAENGNLYIRVITKIWTTREVCLVIKKLIKKYPKLFIPINNLSSILTEWINNYFLGNFRVLLVCGEGYIYYDLSGNKTKLTLQEACDYINKDLVDVIPSTSAGYRALDFPNLENIMLVEGLKAGVVLQSIGRIARGDHMNIITLSPLSGKRIPVYSSSDESRKELYQGYYKFCNVTNSTILEDNL